MLDPVAKLKELAEIGANVTAIVGNPRTAHFGARLMSDLEALHAQTFKGDEFEEGRKLLRERREAAKAATGKHMEKVGPELWRKWHERAMEIGEYAAAAPSIELDWIEKEITSQLPCGECKTHFKKLLSEFFPFGFQDYFNTTVNVHNDVSQRLGKRVMEHIDARALYS